MRTDTTAINNVLLPGTILLANIDVTGLAEYALRAAVGGAIWFGFKMGADFLERRKNNAQTHRRTVRSRKLKNRS
jgi:hypothetical protein